MRGRAFALPLLVLTVSLAACSGLTQVQDSITKFDQGAHSVATAEMAFLGSARIADCNYQFYTAALTFANDPAPVPQKSLVLEAPCTPEVLPNQDFVTRQKLMDAITLYADQIQAVAAAGSDSTLSKNAQTLATKINTLAKNNGLWTSSGPIPSAVESAVAGLAGMVLSAQQLQDIHKAASAEATDLATVVTYLKQENTQLAENMAAKRGDLADILDTTLAQLKQAGTLTVVTTRRNTTIRRANDPRVLLDAFAARRILQAADPAGTTAFIAGTPAPAADPTSVAQQVNVALDGLVSANDAIAHSGTGGIVAAVTDLVARARAARAMQTALNN